MNLFDLYAKISLDTSEYDRELDAASGKTRSFGDKLKSGLATAAKAGAVALGAATTAVGVLTKTSLESYSNYEQLVGGVETLFKDSSDTIMGYAENAYKTAGVSANQYMETVTSFAASLIQSTGRGAQQDLEVLESSLDEQYTATKRALEDQYKATQKSWTDRIALAKKSKDANLDILKQQKDEELKALKRSNEDQLKSLKAHNKEALKEAEAANNQSTTTAESLQRAAKLSDLAITDMSDNANKMGTAMESIQNAYQGFAKQNFTMLDNLKLGYGGTKEEMERLLADAERLSGVKYNISSYADIVQAIHEVQTEMGITGTTAEEAEKTIQGSVASMKSAWENLVTGLGNENADLSDLVGKFSDSAITAGKNVLPRIEKILVGIGESVKKIAPLVTNLLPTVLTDITPDMISAGMGMLSSIASGVMGAVPQLLDVAKKVFDTFVEYLRENLPQLISSGLDALLSFSSGLREGAGKLVDSALTLIQTLADGLIKALPDLISKVPEIVSNIAGIINDNAPKLLVTAGELIFKLAKGLVDNIPIILENMPKIIGAIWDTITAVNWIHLGATLLSSIANGIKSMGGNLLNTVKGVLQHPIDFIKGLFSTFKNMGSQIIQFFSSGISGMASMALNAVKSIQSSILGVIRGLISSALGWGRDLISGFADGILGGIRLVTDAVKSVADKVTSFLHFSRPDKGPLREYETWMPDFMKGLAAGIDANAWRVEDALGNLTGQMRDDFSSAVPSPSAFGKENAYTTQAAALSFPGITININGIQFSTVKELAKAVGDEVQSAVERSANIYGTPAPA